MSLGGSRATRWVVAFAAGVALAAVWDSAGIVAGVACASLLLGVSALWSLFVLTPRRLVRALRRLQLEGTEPPPDAVACELALADAWARAAIRSDRAAIEQLLAPGATITNRVSGGVSARDAYLRGLDRRLDPFAPGRSRVLEVRSRPDDAEPRYWVLNDETLRPYIGRTVRLQQWVEWVLADDRARIRELVVIGVPVLEAPGRG